VHVDDNVINNYIVEVENEQQIKEYKESNKYISYYEKNKKHVEVVVEKGNVALFDVGAVVNAANCDLFPGSGVCGAIFSNAGYKELYEECMKIGGCETGSAVITNGYNLKAPYIIHTVGPIYESDDKSAPLLKSAYLSTLDIADGYLLKEIAIPSISTGVYGYPKEKALDIALDVVLNYEAKVLEKVILVCYDDLTYDMYVKELAKRKQDV
jgi:O-acetyl-ADP-ribose deacetylase (regulator of RNase III)